MNASINTNTNDTIDISATEIPQQPSHVEPLKRRVKATGHRHGRALGNAGVMATSYTQGFASGFMSAFRD
jgi:hypothetical protein